MVAGYWILPAVGLHESDSFATLCILLMQLGQPKDGQFRSISEKPYGW